MSYRSPMFSTPIQLDPSAPGTTVRRAFLFEAILNLFSFPLLTHTQQVLSIVLKHPHHMNASSILFARLFGGIVVGVLTPALLFGYRNTKAGIESRKVVYVSLGLGEMALIPMLLLEARKEGKDAALSATAALTTVSVMLPPLIWRIYTLFVDSSMIGRYREISKDV